MTLDEARRHIDAGVVYNPSPGTYEDGEIVSVNDHYALRYVGGTPLVDRKHGATVGRWATAEEADSARLRTTFPELLEVVIRNG